MPRVTEPRPYILTIEMLYEDDENTKYRSVVYNSTIEIVEAAGAVDVKQWMTYAMLAAIAFGIISLAYNKLAPKKKRRSSAPVSTEPVDDDWASHTRHQSAP